MAEAAPQSVDPDVVPDAPPILSVPVADVADPPAAPAAPAVTTAVPEPNYHIFLWPDPPSPPLYLCLLCGFKDASDVVIQAHVSTEHSATPLPTPMAASPPVVDPVEGLRAVRRQEGTPNG